MRPLSVRFGLLFVDTLQGGHKYEAIIGSFWLIICGHFAGWPQTIGHYRFVLAYYLWPLYRVSTNAAGVRGTHQLCAMLNASFQLRP
jgi:membrane protein required for beta-lactamase induction